jgi:Xaa-Pro aminopeptidase
MISRRELLSSVVAGGVPLSIASIPTPGQARPATGTESAKLFLPQDHLAAATTDRLPLTWSKERTGFLQARLAAAGYHGILLTNQWNIIYFTGLFHTNTERLMHAFIPTVGDHPIWFYPAIDRELLRSWWYEDGDMFFDWLNVAGSAPQDGKVAKGPTQDLWRWVLDGLKRRGFGGRKLVVDRELAPSAQKTAIDVLTVPMANAAEECMYLRMRKTPEELTLTKRAYAYADRIHAFARDLLLTHGTDLTDFELANTAAKFGTDTIMADIKRDGRPHSAVGITIEVNCGLGRSTAYPHGNQFDYNRVERGKAMQFESTVRIGGCGGELYRPYMIAPRTAQMERIWTVARDGCLMQKDLSRHGVECADVAFSIHQYQVKQGMQKYIYNRPAHGQGMEGHQPPYIALGDHTVLDTGMCFSVEPGLYDLEADVGSNFSDLLAIQPEGPALQMSRLPWSEEWAWVTI